MSRSVRGMMKSVESVVEGSPRRPASDAADRPKPLPPMDRDPRKRPPNDFPQTLLETYQPHRHRDKTRPRNRSATPAVQGVGGRLSHTRMAGAGVPLDSASQTPARMSILPSPSASASVNAA